VSKLERGFVGGRVGAIESTRGGLDGKPIPWRGRGVVRLIGLGEAGVLLLDTLNF